MSEKGKLEMRRGLTVWLLTGCLCGWAVWMGGTVAADESPSPLPKLLQVLSDTDDGQLRLDVLRGITDAFSGRRQVQMPEGWSALETELGSSDDPEVRRLAQGLALKFGSQPALERGRREVLDSIVDTGRRRDSLQALLAIGDPGLTPTLLKLLEEPALRGQALRALARYEDPDIGPAILEAYPDLSVTERRDALTTLASRRTTALLLLESAGSDEGPVEPRHLTAEIVRQLRSLEDPAIDERVASVWGRFSESSDDKLAEIERYRQIFRAGGSTPGDGPRGRAVYARICQQCHTLFGVGGNVGPDLTGSNRRDLNYLLQNIVDPNAVIPNEYRSSTLELSDGRVITGLVKGQDANAVTVQTQNETLVIPRDQVDLMDEDRLSMMPEGLMTPLQDQEVRDLLYYLRGPGQAPLIADRDTVDLFFNGHDLSNWDGDPNLWSVSGGEIIGKTETGLKKNAFLISQMRVADFRLICEVKLMPNSENSGIQFRSEPEPGGSVKGYQADVGQGWWGKLYEEHGRALLWDKSGERFVNPGEWNTYEILAVGHHIQTAINGGKCVDLHDPEGAEAGIIAVQLHSGGPMEIRFRNFQLEVDPEPTLKTLKR